MKSLNKRILLDGHSLDGGILKVDRFINEQMDPYRLSVADQNVGYNQPPEPGFYLGPDNTAFVLP